MLQRLKRKLTYANVMATIAVFGVLAGGGAYAAQKIGSSQIKKNAIATKHIKKNAVKAAKIADGAVGTRKIDAGTVGVALAGADVGENGENVYNWFNRFGGQPTVIKTDTGQYEVTFPGLEGRLGIDAIVSATPVASQGDATQVTGGCGGGTGDCVAIRTTTSAGAPADVGFNLVVMAPS